MFASRNLDLKIIGKNVVIKANKYGLINVVDTIMIKTYKI
jgi:hypothetical protein